METGDWMNWSSWIREGYFVSYMREGVRYYEHVIARDLGHWEYDWPETIDPSTESGPFVPANLEITRGYESVSNTNQIWQMIFGINHNKILVYVELPTDIHRHGIPKSPKPSSDMRRTSHFVQYMSPWIEPSFLSEHIMMRPDTQQIAFSAYNANNIDITDFNLNIIINKLLTERIGYEAFSENEQVVLKPSRPRFNDVLQKLYNRTIAQRPLTLLGVRAPAEAPGGQ